MAAGFVAHPELIVLDGNAVVVILQDRRRHPG